MSTATYLSLTQHPGNMILLGVTREFQVGRRKSPLNPGHAQNNFNGRGHHPSHISLQGGLSSRQDPRVLTLLSTQDKLGHLIHQQGGES